MRQFKIKNLTVIILTSVFLFTVKPAVTNSQTINKDENVERIFQELLKFRHNFLLEKQIKDKEIFNRIQVQLGPWYCIGPFKHEFKGIHFDAFETVFGPEEQVLNATRKLVNLKQEWEAKKFPGIIKTSRRWLEHPEWTDGYLCELPEGPPPGLNETNYLYRTITVKEDVSLDMEIIAKDDVKAWINGHFLGKAYPAGDRSSCRYPAGLRVKLPLKKGENRLLVKVTCMFGSRHFSFALPLLTVHNEIWPYDVVQETGEGFTKSFKSVDRFYPGFEPYSKSIIQSDEEIETRYRAYMELKNGIPQSKNIQNSFDAYVGGIIKVLELPQTARDMLPQKADKEQLAIVRNIYYKANKYTDASARLREFHFEVPLAPMYDPPELKMQQVMDDCFAGTPEGNAYIEDLNILKLTVNRALEKSDNGKADESETIFAADKSLTKWWNNKISALGPIVFHKSSRYFTNTEAVTPYIPDGETPARICVYDPSQPEKPVEVIYDDPDGAILDLNLSYDAKTVFFSAKPEANKRGNWDIYEIGIDGNNFRRITYNMDHFMGSEGRRFYDSNISPVELPSGEIAFISTRANTYVNCQTNPAGFLYVCNRDGSNVRRLSGNTESDHTPQVLNDGRIIFTRWDYGVDKNVFVRQSLWTLNPDGSHLQLFSGNTIEDPNSFWNARAIPGLPAVACVFGPHHNYHAGMIGLVWNYLGFEVPRGTGFRWITTELPLYDDITLPWGYRDPFPINERLFLVSYGGDGGEKNRIYLLDDKGNKKCIYEDPELSSYNPILLQPRKKPPVIAASSDHKGYQYRDPADENQDPQPEWGTFFVQDVYQGIETLVKRGEIKSLAIMEQLPKTAFPYRGGQWGAVPVTGRGTMHVRRLVGTVPVESDGSAHFKAPAIRDISFNALDAEGRTIMKMGSATQVMPGETIGCIGCHEPRNSTPPTDKYMPIAAMHKASIPERTDWGTNGIIDFVKVVQPVFDKQCTSCHSGLSPEANIDLSNDKTRLFNMAYNNLVDRGLVDYAMCNSTDHEETTPKSVGALVSKISEFIETDHSGKVLSLEDRQRIYYWIDAGIPYYGTYTYTNPYAGRHRWYTQEKDGWYSGEFMPVFNRRCVSCHEGTILTQAYNYRHHNPEGAAVKVTSKIWTEYAQREWFSGEYAFVGPCHRINLTHPEWSQMLTAPLAISSGGLGLCSEKDGSPVFSDKTDPDYQKILSALQKAHQRLMTDPRVDMLDEIPPRTGIVLRAKQE
jgi:hypothetical protein